jgi:hypothetical protein
MTPRPSSDHALDDGAHLVRQQIGDPHHGAAIGAVREHLHRRAVVREARAADQRPRERARLVVDVDDQLARDEAVPEGHHPRAPLERRVDDEARRLAPVDRAHVADGVPDVTGRSLDCDLASDRCHQRRGVIAPEERERRRAIGAIMRPGTSSRTPAIARSPRATRAWTAASSAR